ncbi:putative GPI-anchored protein, partial [Sesamum angolense]
MRRANNVKPICGKELNGFWELILEQSAWFRFLTSDLGEFLWIWIPQLLIPCGVVSRVSMLPDGSRFHWLLQFIIWLCSFENVLALESPQESSHISSASMLASPPRSGIFKPIEISPTVIPHYSFPGGALPPMYPTYPSTYEPVLTGRCPGFYSTSSDNLVLQNAAADDCFKDIVSILASRGANSSIPTICSTKSSNLTGGSCPVKDINTFEKTVNTSKLFEACSSIDPLKECCRPICQPVIMEAALKISGMQSYMNDNKNAVGVSDQVNVLNDCKGVVFSWISRKLAHDSADKVFRRLSACKVNKACPLDLKQPSEVIAACRNVAAPSPSCCSTLNTYIAGIQRQMLITNRQAIICATVFGSMLQKGGVMTNVYELCDVDLKDFSLQHMDKKVLFHCAFIFYSIESCILMFRASDTV